MMSTLRKVAIAALAVSLVGCWTRGRKKVVVSIDPRNRMTFNFSSSLGFRQPAPLTSLDLVRDDEKNAEVVCRVARLSGAEPVFAYSYGQAIPGYEQTGCGPLSPGPYQLNMSSTGGGAVCWICVDGTGRIRAEATRCKGFGKHTGLCVEVE